MGAERSLRRGRLTLSAAATVTALAMAMSVHDVEVVAQSAGPSVTAVTGTIGHGSSVQVTGSGFGTKPTAAPLKWDNFEAGANSAQLTGWYLEANDGVNVPTFSSAVTRTNSGLSARANFINGNSASNFGVKNTPLPKIYLDTWFYFDAVAPYSRNVKVFRVMPGSPGPGDLYWGYFCDTYPNDSIIGADTTTGNNTAWFKIGPADLSRKWSHVQVYLEESSVGVDDGTLVVWVNGVKQVDDTGTFRTRSGSTNWSEILLGNYFSHGPGGTDCPNAYGDAYTYWDDVYLDTTRAHVEIGDAPSYAAVQHSEIQIPTAWADGAITLTLNKGSFSSFTGLYLYVTDSQGRVNATGLPLVAGTDVTPPTVTSTQPASGATSVAAGGAVRATFSEPMNVATISTSTFELRDAGNALVAGTVSYSSSTNTATLQPSVTLSPAAAYTATVKSGSTGVKDAAGNALGSNVVWSFTTAAASAPAPPGLVAAYAFNEGSGTTAADSSAQNNNGTVTSASWVAGKFGSGLSFNGTNAWVTVPDSASLNLTTGLTMEAWVNPTALSGWRTVVLKEIPGGLKYSLYANDNAPKPAAYIHLAGASIADGVGGVSAVALNTWTHLAATHDGTTARLFVNGVQVSSQPLAGSLIQAAGLFRIGGNAVWGEYFSGAIDEVRIYNRALTAAEINSDMNTPIGATPTDTTPPAVSVTGPAADATVAGTVTLSATASDNVSVTGVQFKVDGTNVGAEDVAAPYSVSWTSGTVSNGTHAITAVARDGAGNQATSAAVSVTVSNTSPDTTPPLVSTVFPAANATKVAPATTVTGTFSEAMLVSSVSTASIELRNSSNVLVPATVSYNTSTKMFTLQPSIALLWKATYHATVKSGSAGVKDLAGNALAGDYSWSFTTQSQPPAPPKNLRVVGK